MAKRLIWIFRRGAAAMQNEIIQNADVPGVSTFLYREAYRFPNCHVTSGETVALAGVTNGYACSQYFPAFSERWQNSTFRSAAYFAIGNDNPTRSHFYEQDRISGGGFDFANLNSGVYNRWAVDVAPLAAPYPLDLISVGKDISRAIIGVVSPYAATRTGVPNLTAAQIARATTAAAGFTPTTRAQEVLAENQLAIRNTFNSLTALAASFPALLPSEIAGAGAAPQYVADAFGNDLKVVAKLIAAGATSRVLAINSDYPWDTHVQMRGSPNSPAAPTGAAGNHHTMLVAFDQNMRAFMYDLENIAGNPSAETTIVCQTEFHRTQRENGAFGTDHGHAGHAYIWSPNVTSGLYGAQLDFSENQDPATSIFTNPGSYQQPGPNRFFKYTFEYRDFQRMQLEWLMGRRMTSGEIATVWGDDFVSNPPAGEYASLAIT